LLEGVLDGLTCLSSLSLAHCKGITDKGIKAISSKNPGLRHIILDECSVTSQGVMWLVDDCPELRELSLKRCDKVDDDAVSYLAQKCEIQKLNLNAVTNLTGGAIEALVNGCSKTIVELDVSWCRGIPQQALGYMVQHCPRLARVTAWGNTQLEEPFLYGHGNDSLDIIGRGENLVRIDPITMLRM